MGPFGLCFYLNVRRFASCLPRRMAATVREGSSLWRPSTKQPTQLWNAIRVFAVLRLLTCRRRKQVTGRAEQQWGGEVDPPPPRAVKVGGVGGGMFWAVIPSVCRRNRILAWVSQFPNTSMHHTWQFGYYKFVLKTLLWEHFRRFWFFFWEQLPALNLQHGHISCGHLCPDGLLLRYGSISEYVHG